MTEAKDLAQKALADAMRQYQHKHQLTIKGLGERLGISEQYVWKLLSGRGWPSSSLLVRLRQLRVVDVNALLDDVAGGEREAA